MHFCTFHYFIGPMSSHSRSIVESFSVHYRYIIPFAFRPFVFRRDKVAKLANSFILALSAHFDTLSLCQFVAFKKFYCETLTL